MFQKILNKLFNRSGGGKKKAERGVKPGPDEGDGGAEEPKPTGPVVRHQDIPNRIKEGIQLKAIPERMPDKPRAWNVSVTSFDHQGFWVNRIEADDIPVPVEEGDMLSLVLFDKKIQLIYDCLVLRIEGGGVEKILVGPPKKTVQEESQLTNLGGRKHLRISFRLPVELRSVAAGQLGAPISAHTMNISVSGLAVECGPSFEAGQEIEVRILSWNFPLKVRAFVVRSATLESGKNVVAVSFPPDMSTISKDLIGQFILENQRNV